MNHAVGSRYDAGLQRAAQALTRQAVQAIARQIQPGMREDTARQMANETLRAMGFERRWHPSLVRFGENTLCTYLQPSSPSTLLGEDDVFFIDIGPVLQGHEGDGGATFAVGQDPEHHAASGVARRLWEDVAAHWRSTGCCGQALYAEAARLAEAAGWRLNLGIQGHRVGDFPHAIHKAPDLGMFKHTPAPDLWILEIQIAHPTRPFGAFHEDLLEHP
jgi:Xaa-Pro aminopeptidase